MNDNYKYEIKINNCPVILSDKHSIISYRKNLFTSINLNRNLLKKQEEELNRIDNYISNKICDKHNIN